MSAEDNQRKIAKIFFFYRTKVLSGKKKSKKKTCVSFDERNGYDQVLVQ